MISLSSNLEQNPDVINAILEKSVLCGQKPVLRRAKPRDATRRKNFMEGAGLPGKLADCSEEGREQVRDIYRRGRFCRRFGQNGPGRPSVSGHPSFVGKDAESRENPDATRLLAMDKLQPVIASLGAGIGEKFRRIEASVPQDNHHGGR
jgi:DNA gyrase subunit B